jgi:trimeric autotransporter adhesin
VIDEAGLAGWQSGLYYVDRSAKASAAVVHDWIASTGAACQGPLRPWTPPGIPAVAPPPAKPQPQSRTRIIAAVGGRLRIFDSASHALRRVLAPFGAGYTGPLSVGLGAVNRDNVTDVAVAEGAGTRAAVKVLDGKTGKTIASYFPFPRSFRGGVTVALADVTGDRRADLVVGSGPGMANEVKVYDTDTHKLVTTLSPFPRSFRGGVSVSAGDVDGDRKADLIVGSGPGAPAKVEVFDAVTRELRDSFSPFAPSFRGGVSVGVASARGRTNVIVGSGAGTIAIVRVFAYAHHTPLWSFDAFSPTFTGGAAVAGGPAASLVVGAGAGGGSQVKVLDPTNHTLTATFLAAPGSAPVAVAAG